MWRLRNGLRGRRAPARLSALSPGLLSALYQTKTFEPDASADGIYRYHHWLPIVRQLHGSGRTVTYQSERLSRVVGLPNLWVAFNGCRPEKGAALQTTTFKDLEAWTVLRAWRVTIAASW